MCIYEEFTDKEKNIGSKKSAHFTGSTLYKPLGIAVLFLVLCGNCILSLASESHFQNNKKEPVESGEGTKGSSGFTSGVETRCPAWSEQPDNIRSLLTMAGQSSEAIGSKLTPHLHEPHNNTVFSPLSVAVPLTLVGAGARGETSLEFARLLIKDFTENGQPAHTFIPALVESQAELSKFMAESGLVKSANLILLDEKYKLTENYQQILNRFMVPTTNTRLQTVKHFDTPDIVTEINEFARQNTDGKIPEVLDKELDPDVALVLVNTVLLKALWPEKLQTSDNFYFEGSTGNQTLTPALIYRRANTAYIDINNSNGKVKNNWSVAWLPLTNKEFGVLLAMPETDSETAFREDAGIFSEAFTTLSVTNHDQTVHFPKLKVESALNLKKTFQETGLMYRAFSWRHADFSGLSDSAKAGQLIISNIFHKAIIELDEVGVQATAATIVRLNRRSAGPPLPGLFFNRPFKLFVAHKPSGALLFESTINKTPEQPDTNW